jgi:hypothetical protein
MLESPLAAIDERVARIRASVPDGAQGAAEDVTVRTTADDSVDVRTMPKAGVTDVAELVATEVARQRRIERGIGQCELCQRPDVERSAYTDPDGGRYSLCPTCLQEAIEHGLGMAIWTRILRGAGLKPLCADQVLDDGRTLYDTYRADIPDLNPDVCTVRCWFLEHGFSSSMHWWPWAWAIVEDEAWAVSPAPVGVVVETHYAQGPKTARSTGTATISWGDAVPQPRGPKPSEQRAAQAAAADQQRTDSLARSRAKQADQLRRQLERLEAVAVP